MTFMVSFGVQSSVQLKFEEGGSGTALSCILTHPRLTCPESLDFSPILQNIGPLPNQMRWQNWKSGWPSRETVSEMIQLGISLVPRNGYQWKVSTGMLEVKLMEGMRDDPYTNGCRRKSHRILKKLNENYFCDPTKPVIYSYVLKVMAVHVFGHQTSP